MKIANRLVPCVSRGLPFALAALVAGAIVPAACGAPADVAPHAPPGGAGLEGAAAAPADASAATGGDDGAAEAGPPVAPVAFAPCEDDPALQCGTVRVPLDHNDPREGALDMAVIRAPATGARRLGAVVVNPGGPGISGVDKILFDVGLLAPLREHFDLVGFDPRGVGRTRNVTCNFDAPPPPAPGDEAASNQFFDEVGRRVAAACLEQNGAIVNHMSTNDVARDVDLLRRALGEKQINYLGYSYGTILGAAYASLFPKRVRAMVLDGAVQPEFEDYLAERFVEQFSAPEFTLQRLAQVCAADPACPLFGHDLVATLDHVVARLDAKPFVSEDGKVLTGANVLNGTLNYLFTDFADWRRIVRGLAAARAGDDQTLFELYAPFARPPFPVVPTTLGPSTPFTCTDYATRRPAADAAPVDRAGSALYRHFFRPGSVLSNVARCNAWPVSDPPRIRDVSKELKNPVVIVATDWDTVAPFAATRRLARALGMDANVVRYKGGGHLIYSFGSDCIDAAVNNYFINLDAPEKGFACPALPVNYEGALAPRSLPGEARSPGEARRTFALPEGP